MKSGFGLRVTERENVERKGGTDASGMKLLQPPEPQREALKRGYSKQCRSHGQGWLIAPGSVKTATPVVEPTAQERLQWEDDFFGYVISSHPLELFPLLPWDTYCPVNRLGGFVGETVKVGSCG